MQNPPNPDTAQRGGVLLSQHGGYQVRFVPGGGFSGEDVLRFENMRGRLKFAVLLSDPQQELTYLLALLRQAAGGPRVIESSPIGAGRCWLLRLLGRSIEFADEFAVRVKRRSMTSQAEHIASTRFVFAQLRGWLRPSALILVTNGSQTIPLGPSGPSKRWSGNFRKWRLSHQDCRRLADGLERLLPVS